MKRELINLFLLTYVTPVTCTMQCYLPTKLLKFGIILKSLQNITIHITYHESYLETKVITTIVP